MDIKKPSGRPRKFTIETPPEPVQQVLVQNGNEQVVPLLEQTALGIAKNDNNRWCVYSFKFNPLTHEVKFESMKEEISKVGATIRFKKMAVDILR